MPDTTYGQDIVWTGRNPPSRTRVSVEGCATPEEARDQALAAAKDLGWTPPKWWQFWRKNDTRIA